MEERKGEVRGGEVDWPGVDIVYIHRGGLDRYTESLAETEIEFKPSK